jgi:flagellar hook assembly protein FlgD
MLCVLATSSALTAFGEATASGGTVLSDVSVSPSFFNPTLGQKQSIRAHAARSGTLVVEILDRDRTAIRTLEPLRVAAGEVTAIWDGKDQGGKVVPDEAYDLHLRPPGQEEQQECWRDDERSLRWPESGCRKRLIDRRLCVRPRDR